MGSYWEHAILSYCTSATCSGCWCQTRRGPRGHGCLWALAPGHPVPKRAAAARIQSANVGANFACCEIFHDFLNANMLSLQAWVVTYLIGFLLTETAYHS